MAQSTPKAGQGPFEEFASSVLKFSPNGVWRTYLAVWRAGKPGEESLAKAIAEHDRTVVLSPFQYIAGTFAISAITVWLLNRLIYGEFGKVETLSFIDPEMLPLLTAPFLFAVPLHFCLHFASGVNKMVEGHWDGIWKVFQLFMYMLGHFMLFVLFVMLGVALTDLGVAGFAAGIGLAFVGACFTLYPMILRTMPHTLARLYDVSEGRALFVSFTLLMMAVMAESLITTGRLPE